LREVAGVAEDDSEIVLKRGSGEESVDDREGDALPFGPGGEKGGLHFFRVRDIGLRGLGRDRHAGDRTAQQGGGSISERACVFGLSNQPDVGDQQRRLRVRLKPFGRGAGGIENERDLVARSLFVIGGDGGEGSLTTAAA
jgi:hypothetical protein